MTKTHHTNEALKSRDEENATYKAQVKLMEIVGKAGKLEEFRDIVDMHPKLDLNYKNQDGNTFLIVAAKTGKVEIVKHLLEKNSVDPNIVANNRGTFFHLTKSSMGIYSKIHILKQTAILNGFDLDIKDVNGISSRDIINNDNLLSQLLNPDFLYDQNLDENILDSTAPIHDTDVIGQYDDMTL